MTIYSTVLFIHVASAIGAFIVLAAEGAILFRLRSAQTVGEVRFFMGASRRLRIIAIPAFLGILVGGLYLGSKYGAGTYWIPAALAATLLIILIGALVTGIRAARLEKVLSSEQADKSIAAISANTKDNALLISYGLRVGLAMGIVFLMTAKPELSLSMAALGAGALTGLFVARAMWRIADSGKRWEQSGRATHPGAQSS